MDWKSQSRARQNPKLTGGLGKLNSQVSTIRNGRFLEFPHRLEKFSNQRQKVEQIAPDLFEAACPDWPTYDNFD